MDLMGRWIHRASTWLGHPRTATPPASGDTMAAAEDCRVHDTGKYRLLSKYLRDRYASRVVLTFSEIEDLVGFTLPESARRQPEWWDGTTSSSPRTAQSDAWTLADRTAMVNMPAQRVVFDRHTPARAAEANPVRGTLAP